MEKILLLGSPGAGKSTLARKLSSLTGIPHTDLDQVRLDSNFKMTPANSG
jgi:adenylate kinase family enzyme